MNRLLIASLSLALTLSTLSTVRAAEEASPLEAELDIAGFSAYVWRGQVYNDDPVIQPSWTISKGGFSINTWASFNLTDAVSEDTKNEFSEVDLTISYSRLVGPAEMEVGVGEYLYPHQSSLDGTNMFPFPVQGTREVYLKAGLPDVILTPTVSVYYDFDEVQAFYAMIELTHSIEINDMMSLDLAFSTGVGDKDYNSAYFGVEELKLNDGNVSATLPITISESWSVQPMVEYSWFWDSEIKDAIKESGDYFGKTDMFWGGVTLAYTF